MKWKKSGLEEFHEDAARLHDEYDTLARDIIKTLPEEEWPRWVHNRMRLWVWGEDKPIDLGPEDVTPDTFPEEWTSKLQKEAWSPFKDKFEKAKEFYNTNRLKIDDVALQIGLKRGQGNLWECPICQHIYSSPDLFEQHLQATHDRQFNYVGPTYSKWKIIASKWAMRGQPDTLELFERFVFDVIRNSGINRYSEKDYKWIYNWILEETHGVIPEKTTDSWGKGVRITKDYKQLLDKYVNELRQTDIAMQNQIPEGDYRQDYNQQNYNGIVQMTRVGAGLGIPATYSPNDPLDLHGKMPLINAMHVDWADMPPEQAKQVIINAFRATMLSPRMNLKSNAILYQSLMDVPAEESDPDVFESKIRQLKSKWDQQGQTEMGQDPGEMLDPKDTLPGRFMPGFWGNIRRLAALGPYVDDLYKAAMDDIHHGGTGEIFRREVLSLGIPGVQAKVASFAWLALAPNTSELATVDVHMMRHLNQDGDAPRNTKHYLELENQLRTERNNLYGTEVPLAHYQWGVWDARRTPGYHQDHTPLKAYQPTPFQNIAWPSTTRPPRPQVTTPISDDQQSLFSNWKYASESYSLQGRVVSGITATATGIAVRPDRQSQTEILGIIANLATHQDDALLQRKKIPEWAINRGGKVADLQRGPGGVGVTYAQAVICVSEWVNVDDNWLLEHPACRGIVAEKGGGSSHGVTVARTRNIAIVVDAAGANKINTGDTLQIDSGNAIIHVNGGGADQFGEAQEAKIPILRFVWSVGQGVTTPIPNDDPEAGILHRELIVQQYRAGKWNKRDNALGVIYQDGKVQMMGEPSDQQAMITWLNTIHPVTQIENDATLQQAMNQWENKNL